MKNINTIIDNYTKEERSAFALGVLYSQANGLIKDDLFKDYKVEEIMSMILNNTDIPKPKLVSRNTFLTVAGEDFRCSCGTNLFGSHSNGTYECNGCGLVYEGN